MPPNDNWFLWVNPFPFVGFAFLGLSIRLLGVAVSEVLPRVILRLGWQGAKQPTPPASKPSALPPEELEPSARVLCYKCAHANAVGTERCEHCGHSLFVDCRCGTRNLRANDQCTGCGERLRRRRIDPDDPMFTPLGGPAFGPGSGSSSPNDLAAALFVFALVGLIFAFAIASPDIQELQATQKADREEAHQQLQYLQQRRELLELQRIQQLLDRKANPAWKEWINTH